MCGGNTITHEMRLGIDWRPLLASLCLHFGIAISLGLLLSPDQDFPRKSISLAHVTLQSSRTGADRFEPFEDAQTVAGSLRKPIDEGSERLPAPEEAPSTAASQGLAALREISELTSAARVAASGSTSSLRSISNGREFPIGSGGNTEADERLMAKDIERYLASQPPSGPSTEISLFGGTLTGHSFVFVIDRSASTASKHYSACSEIERQCAKAIDKLPAANRFGVILYNDQVSAGPGLRLATMEVKENAKERMIRYSPSGGTMHLDGLRAALLQRPQVICWFSDGGDPYLSQGEVDNLALLAARTKTVIHAWRLGKRPDDTAKDFMRILAERTGGQFREGVPSMP